MVTSSLRMYDETVKGGKFSLNEAIRLLECVMNFAESRAQTRHPQTARSSVFRKCEPWLSEPVTL